MSLSAFFDWKQFCLIICKDLKPWRHQQRGVLFYHTATLFIDFLHEIKSAMNLGLPIPWRWAQRIIASVHRRSTTWTSLGLSPTWIIYTTFRSLCDLVLGDSLFIESQVGKRCQFDLWLEPFILCYAESLEQTCTSLYVCDRSYLSYQFALSWDLTLVVLGPRLMQDRLTKLLVTVDMIEMLGCQVLL